tara:strand:+ start:115 stop:405 length:291 start_codon:yes stop_codon:yes gene_type:complete
MICYNCKQSILENEAVKYIPTTCPDAGTGRYQNGVQCTVYHSAPVHVDVGTGDTDCIKPLSKIEQLEKRIEELEQSRITDADVFKNTRMISLEGEY